MRNKTHELQWLETLFTRKGLNEKELKNYQRLSRGYDGEKNFDLLCELMGRGNLDTLDDVTLNYHRTVVQIDKLIQVGDTIYLVDIKNYKGDYTLKNNELRVGTKLLTHHIVEQLRRAVRQVQTILEEADLRMKVKGVIVFINPSSTIHVVDQIAEPILSYQETVAWLGSLDVDSVASSQSKNWQSLLRTFEVEGYRMKNTYEDERLDKLTKGVLCTQCKRAGLREHRHVLVCQCGQVEVKETAYVRTICEYGLIMHHKDLKLQDLVAFFGDGVNKKYIKRMLRKHFILNGRPCRHASYCNKGVSFKVWFKKQQDMFDKIEGRINWERKV